jgi:2-oxoglutarate dehydrogenase complex dehydrogenase (E1) component-like enzyme
MTPKFLLRYERCVSTVDDLTSGRFREVIDDESVDPAAVKRVLLCTGKVYYTLLKAREAAGRSDAAIVRVEQLYPFPKDEILAALGRYRGAKDVAWVQEEPWNMGAWHFVEARLRPDLGARTLRYVGRDEAASSAVGSQKVSEKEEKAFVEEALG